MQNIGVKNELPRKKTIQRILSHCRKKELLQSEVELNDYERNQETEDNDEEMDRIGCKYEQIKPSPQFSVQDGLNSSNQLSPLSEIKLENIRRSLSRCLRQPVVKQKHQSFHQKPDFTSEIMSPSLKQSNLNIINHKHQAIFKDTSIKEYFSSKTMCNIQGDLDIGSKSSVLEQKKSLNNTNSQSKKCLELQKEHHIVNKLFKEDVERSQCLGQTIKILINSNNPQKHDVIGVSKVLNENNLIAQEYKERQDIVVKNQQVIYSDIMDTSILPQHHPHSITFKNISHSAIPSKVKVKRDLPQKWKFYNMRQVLEQKNKPINIFSSLKLQSNTIILSDKFKELQESCGTMNQVPSLRSHSNQKSLSQKLDDQNIFSNQLIQSKISQIPNHSKGLINRRTREYSNEEQNMLNTQLHSHKKISDSDRIIQKKRALQPSTQNFLNPNKQISLSSSLVEQYVKSQQFSDEKMPPNAFVGQLDLDQMICSDTQNDKACVVVSNPNHLIDNVKSGIEVQNQKTKQEKTERINKMSLYNLFTKAFTSNVQHYNMGSEKQKRVLKNTNHKSVDTNVASKDNRGSINNGIRVKVNDEQEEINRHYKYNNQLSVKDEESKLPCQKLNLIFQMEKADSEDNGKQIQAFSNEKSQEQSVDKPRTNGQLRRIVNIPEQLKTQKMTEINTLIQKLYREGTQILINKTSVEHNPTQQASVFKIRSRNLLPGMSQLNYTNQPDQYMMKAQPQHVHEINDQGSSQ